MTTLLNCPYARESRKVSPHTVLAPYKEQAAQTMRAENRTNR